jgi:hypothetical protein
VAYDAYGYPGPSEPERPIAVTVIGVLGIIGGALGLLSAPLNILYMATGFKAAGPMGEALWANDTYRLYMQANTPVSLVLCGLYLAAGIGLLRLRPWAWTLTIGLLIFGMLSQILNACIMLPLMGTIFNEAMAATSMPTPAPDMSFMKPVIYVSGGFAVVIGLAVMVLFLVLLTRPNVRRAFGHSPT